MQERACCWWWDPRNDCIIIGLDSCFLTIYIILSYLVLLHLNSVLDFAPFSHALWHETLSWENYWNHADLRICSISFFDLCFLLGVAQVVTHLPIIRLIDIFSFKVLVGLFNFSMISPNFYIATLRRLALIIVIPIVLEIHQRLSCLYYGLFYIYGFDFKIWALQSLWILWSKFKSRAWFLILNLILTCSFLLGLFLNFGFKGFWTCSWIFMTFKFTCTLDSRSLCLFFNLVVLILNCCFFCEIGYLDLDLYFGFKGYWTFSWILWSWSWSWLVLWI